MGSMRYGPSRASRLVLGQVPVMLAEIKEGPNGELVTVALGEHDPALVTPVLRIYAVYAPGPPAADESPETFLHGDGRFVGTHPSGALPQGPGSIDIAVNHVPPGNWFVQTVLEMGDPPSPLSSTTTLTAGDVATVAASDVTAEPSAPPPATDSPSAS